MAVFEAQILPKMVSRKFWVASTFWNLQTVPQNLDFLWKWQNMANIKKHFWDPSKSDPLQSLKTNMTFQHLIPFIRWLMPFIQAQTCHVTVFFTSWAMASLLRILAAMVKFSGCHVASSWLEPRCRGAQCYSICNNRHLPLKSNRKEGFKFNCRDWTKSINAHFDKNFWRR